MNRWQLARGFRFAGTHCGIRPDPGRKDLALFVSDWPATAAGVFTQNRVCAAPVQLGRTQVPADGIRGIVVCSGNANACTGEQGLADAKEMAALLAQQLGVAAHDVLVASTGVIGRPLPMAALRSGIPNAFAQLSDSASALQAAAEAILTTDTGIKVRTTHWSEGQTEYRLTGLAKGAAMIGPNLATMLGFLFTDAAVSAVDLHALLTHAANRSFNCISVEGHMSTNDTVFLLANGAAGGKPLQGDSLLRFAGEVEELCQQLAQAIIHDAEGATKILTLKVEGLRSDAEARQVAKAVCESALVKTALFGNDPNWGRIVSAAGYSGVRFDEKDCSLWLAGELLYDRGRPLPFDAAALSAKLKGMREVEARLVFNLGSAGCTFWTCDLTYEYVKLNADYTT